MITKIAININPDDTDSFPLLESIIDLLDARNVTVMLPEYGNLTDKYPHRVKDNETFTREAQVVAVIGGDGTFIRTARIFSGTGTPIFGINRGRLGFLNEFHPGEALS
ncbi:MAG: NAD(+)/NADH kinase, partial [Spirochaetota bacterium]